MVDDQELKLEEAKTNAKEHLLDTRNASGLSKQIKRNEEIDWRNIEQLNSATKMAIQAFEREFTFEDFLKEKEEKEEKKSIEGQDSGEDMDDVEEEEELGVEGWDRQWAERMFIETQEELSKQI